MLSGGNGQLLLLPWGAATAWWVNGIQIKLGLLGKVIGFSILALQIGEIQSFDPSEAQTLLKSLTAGLGVALLTTMVGLVGNILLGLQLTRLDRFADEIVARAQMHGMHLVAASIETRPVGSRNRYGGETGGGEA